MSYFDYIIIIIIIIILITVCVWVILHMPRLISQAREINVRIKSPGFLKGPELWNHWVKNPRALDILELIPWDPKINGQVKPSMALRGLELGIIGLNSS